MCQMINVWVPVRVAAPAPTGWLYLASAGELQKDFLERFPRSGSFFSVYGGTCLCGFRAWETLYALVQDLMVRSEASTAAIVHFWSGDRYELQTLDVDIDDPDDRPEVRVGTVALVNRVPPERRRHRKIVQVLARSVGQRVSLRTKGGAIVGTLTTFDPLTEVGEVDGCTFVAAQVFAV